MDKRIENAKTLFLHSLGDLNMVEKEYADKYHQPFDADIFINSALDDCRAYFGVKDIPFIVTASAIASIATVRYKLFELQNSQIFGLKSSSYSEGSISKSESYSTSEELSAKIESILKPYHRFRVVSGHK